MFRQVRKFSVFLALALLCMSCTRLPRQSQEVGGNVEVETLQNLGSVPAEWGNLVSASTHPINMQTMRLFFEDDEGTIRVVVYDAQLLRLWPNVGVIRRQ